MRLANFSVVGCFLVAILIMTMWPEGSRFGAPSRSFAKVQDSPEPVSDDRALSQDTSLAEVAEEALKLVVSLDFAELSFFEVKKQLEKKTGLEFVLTPSAINDSLSEQEIITFQMDAVPMNKGLALMLERYNAAYVIDGGIVKIVSLDDALDPKWHRIKMFDCRKLLNSLPATATVVSGNGFSGGGAQGPGVGGNHAKGGFFAIQPMAPQLTLPQSTPAVPREEPEGNDSWLLEQKLNQLVALIQAQAKKSQPKPSSEHTLLDLVTSMISSDSWEHAMGTGKIRVVNGILIVSQTDATLLEIEGFLADLEVNVLTSGGTGLGEKSIKNPAANLTAGSVAPEN